MTFFRPEAMALLTRWAETAIYAALTLIVATWVAADPGWSAPARWIAAAALAMIGLWLTRSAALSALARGAARSPGVVQIDERRIAFLAPADGPYSGGVASLNEIVAVEIATPDPAFWRHHAEWIFRVPTGEPALIVPASAEGADGLIDACAALPGFSPTRALSALNGSARQTFIIWRRDGGEPLPALAHFPRRE